MRYLLLLFILILYGHASEASKTQHRKERYVYSAYLSSYPSTFYFSISPFHTLITILNLPHLLLSQTFHSFCSKSELESAYSFGYNKLRDALGVLNKAIDNTKGICVTTSGEGEREIKRERRGIVFLF